MTQAQAWDERDWIQEMNPEPLPTHQQPSTNAWKVGDQCQLVKQDKHQPHIFNGQRAVIKRIKGDRVVIEREDARQFIVPLAALKELNHVA